MKSVAWDLVQLLQSSQDGSAAAQYARKKIIMLLAQNNQAVGVRNQRLSSLKHQNFAQAIQRWKKENLSSSIVRNRVAVQRWVAESNGKLCPVVKDNQ